MNLDATIKAIQDGVTKLAAHQGVKNIDGWLTTLEKEEFRGAKTIHENLSKLKKHLEGGELDGPAIGKLLQTLGEESKRAAHFAGEGEGKKVEHLGELLEKAAGELHKGK